MLKWFNEVGYDVNVNELHKDYPDIEWQTFSNWVKLQDWSVLEP